MYGVKFFLASMNNAIDCWCAMVLFTYNIPSKSKLGPNVLIGEQPFQFETELLALKLPLESCNILATINWHTWLGKYNDESNDVTEKSCHKSESTYE